MKTKHIITTLFLLFFMQSFAQKIKQGEYFYDTDPGVGSGTPIIISTPSDSVSRTFTFSTVGLNNNGLFKGFHQIYVRFKDSLNRWGITDAYPFYVYDTLKTTAPSLSARLNAGEYFIDTDPGVGLGTGIPSITIGDSVYKTFSFSTAGLTNTGLFGGFHQVFYRFRDSLGRWSFTNNMPFYVYDTTRTNQVIAAQINQGEYFIDTDPGVGSGTSFTFTGPVDSVQTTFNLSTTGLSVGLHNVYIRFKGTDGKWGFTDQKQFRVCNNIFASPTVTGNTSICATDTLKLFASIVAGAIAYKWTGPNGFTSNSQNISIANTSNIHAGVYKVISIRTGGSGCDTSNEVLTTVIVNSAPTAQSLTVSGNLNVCSSDSVMLSIANQIGFNYRWLRNGINTTNIADTFNSYTAKTSGTYTVKVTNTNGCFSNMRDTLVTINPKPNTSAINGNGNVLVSSTQTYSVTNTSSSGYNWIVGNGTINSGNGSSSISVTWPSSAGTGSVKVIETGSTGCKGDTQTLSINISSFTLNVNPLSLSYTNSASSKKVGVSSNTNWSVSSNQTWATVNKANGTNNDSITITVSANSTFVERTATVTFTAGTLTQTVSVTQSGSIPDSLNLDFNSLTFTATGSTKQVQLTSNKNWTISGKASWVTLTPNGGSGNTTLNITTSANTSSISRTNSISFTAGTATQILIITQDSTPATADQLSLNKDSIVTGSSALSTTVQLQSNRSWTITNPASWVTISPMSGTNNAILSVNILANSTTSVRTVDVLISAGTIVKELRIKQDASVSVNEINSSNNLNIYPNPTSGIITISSSQVIANIDVFDVTGKLVFSQQNCNKQTKSELDLSALTNGIYFIHAVTENGGVSKSKVVVSK